MSEGGAVNKKHSETWTEDLFGEGACTGFDHVKIPKQYQPLLSEMNDQERFMLDSYWETDDLTEGASRLASQITVGREMEGMVVYIPDGLADDDY